MHQHRIAPATTGLGAQRGPLQAQDVALHGHWQAGIGGAEVDARRISPVGEQSLQVQSGLDRCRLGQPRQPVVGA